MTDAPAPGHLPTPPWRSDAHPRRRLDRESIGREALRLIDAEGIDAVSMRRVAAAFDTGPASLYAHVENKEALLRLALDLASGEAMLESTERVLGLMIEAGVPAQVAAWSLDIISLYVGADAYEGWLFGQ